MLDVAKLTGAAVEVVGNERRSVAGASRLCQNDVSLGRHVGVPPVALRRVAWILEVLVWRCRARRPNVLLSFLKCSMTAHTECKLSPRDRAIIRELNETVFAFQFLETGGIGWLNHVKSEVLHLVHRPGITCTSPSPLCDL